MFDRMAFRLKWAQPPPPKLTNKQPYWATHHRKFFISINFLNVNNYINYYIYGIGFTIIFTITNGGYQKRIYIDYCDYRPITLISKYLVEKKSWHLKSYYSIFWATKGKWCMYTLNFSLIIIFICIFYLVKRKPKSRNYDKTLYLFLLYKINNNFKIKKLYHNF